MNKGGVGKRVDLDVLKNAIFDDISTLLDSLELEYRQEQDNIFMCCPAHSGSDNPNGCSISIKHKRWHCWTHGCHEQYGRDILGFVKGAMQTENFADVLKHLSTIYAFNHTTSKLALEVEPENDIIQLSKIFQKKLYVSRSPSTQVVKTCGRSPYFESRGFSASTLKEFKVEDCEDSKSPMKFRAIIPIIENGVSIAFIARGTRPWVLPKYLFSDGFKKTEHLYNYTNGMEAGLKKNALFVVEGQGDVWKMYECGVKNCVGLFGKSVSDAQEDLLIKSGITNLIILTDNDSSGRESKVDIKRRLSRMFKLIFPKMYSKDLGSMFASQVHSKILSTLKGYY
jgi:DNA primase